MDPKKISIKGARVHNLKNIDLELPRDHMIVFSGLSGSGKSSLAFETIFAEGQRRYVESLSPYARQFLGQMEKPDVDEITGLSPAIAIDQKAHSSNPRSTVATLTEIYDYLRVLFARIGQPYHPKTGKAINKLAPEEMVDTILKQAKERKVEVVTIMAPVVRGRKGEYYQLLQNLYSEGFTQARIDSVFQNLNEKVALKRYGMHSIDVVVDKIFLKDPEAQTRLFEAVELALYKAEGLVSIVFSQTLKAIKPEEEMILSSSFTDPETGFSFPELSPRLFSFNSPYGACEACHGLGKNPFDFSLCEVCWGKRLRPEALSVKIGGANIDDVVRPSIEKSYQWFSELPEHLSENQKKIAVNVLREITDRLEFLLEVGLDYLTLNRESGTLSGGEAQRIRLASQIGSKLSGTLYVLDEPTIGLHERDNERLIKTLKNLKNLGNTIIVVEHDERVLKESDYFVEIGPGPGLRGGEIVVAGETKKLLAQKKHQSLTLQYLSSEREIALPQNRRKKDKGSIQLVGASKHNIKNLNVSIPLGRLVCVTGVSGSGKSTLLELANRNIQKQLSGFSNLENVAKVLGTEYLKKIIKIDQSPIGKTPRSNPATYTGVFTPIRDLFSLLPEAKARSYGSSRFSFNVPSRKGGGRCEACQGAGVKVIEMHFLPDVYVSCDVCNGKRFNRETLEVKYKGFSIADVLEMTVEESYKVFKEIYHIADKLQVLQEVGLGYIKLGQRATTLSGGEAQRIKLSKELARPLTRNALFILDEPTTGLHYEDIKMLLSVIQRLVDKGNSVILIEHNMHVIKVADYIIDMGPEGGEGGGKIVAQGIPEQIAKDKNSHTGRYLKDYLKG
ncbi:MAG: excinuclease ABC subunit UvrA [Candidatus Harrisonbacteria bacterium]|nr:excinuclease ABC subunit UvrA [Candidatus Harrisonbacteria bacterium]